LQHEAVLFETGSTIKNIYFPHSGIISLVHISALERAGLSTLNEGATVDYEIISDRGKESAGNLKVRK
jgi:hypothetical protein